MLAPIAQLTCRATYGRPPSSEYERRRTEVSDPSGRKEHGARRWIRRLILYGGGHDEVTNTIESITTITRPQRMSSEDIRYACRSEVGVQALR